LPGIATARQNLPQERLGLGKNCRARGAATWLKRNKNNALRKMPERSEVAFFLHGLVQAKCLPADKMSPGSQKI
jgi:hypothetical protein